MLATSGNASILNMSDRIGAISPCRIADMIAVEGNPLEDLGVVSKVRMVMKAGRFLKGRPERITSGSSPNGSEAATPGSPVPAWPSTDEEL